MSQAVSGVGSPIVAPVFHEEVQAPPSDKERCEKLVRKINSVRGWQASFVEGMRFETQLSGITTLADLRATEEKPFLRDRLIKEIKVQKSIDKLNEHFPFFERLKKVSYEVLENVSLFSLQIVQALKDAKTSAVADALIEEEAFVRIPVQDLPTHLNLEVFAIRMNHIHRVRPDLRDELAQTSLKKPYFWGNLQLPAAKLPLRPGEEIMDVSPWLPAEAFGLLTDDQVKSLDFSKLPLQKILHCIRGGIGDEKTIQRRFSLLSPEQLSLVLKVASDDLLRIFPIELIDRVPVAELSKEQIHELFCNNYTPREERRKKIAVLSPDTITAILPKLEVSFLLLLSDDQIRGMDYSKVTAQQLEGMFRSWMFGTDEKERRIALIPPQSIRFAAKVAELHFFAYLSTEQVLALDAASLSKEQVAAILIQRDLTEEEKREFIPRLSVPAVEHIVQLVASNVLKYISDEQLSQMNLEDVPKLHLDSLFPSLDPADWRLGYVYSFSSDTQHRWEQRELKGRPTNVTHHSVICLGDEMVQKIIALRKAECLKNFHRVSEQQFASIVEEISPEVLRFFASHEFSTTP